MADQFEALAIQILNKFHQENPEACIEAMKRRIPAYGNATWLEVAFGADAKNFISQKPVQNLLNDLWFVKSKLSKENLK